MSSGLTENNAFTTTLVFRLFGLLLEAGAVSAVDGAGTKLWESGLKYKNFKRFAKKLTQTNKHAFSKYLFNLFPEDLQAKLNSFVKNGANIDKVKKETNAELERLIRCANLYDSTLLKGVKLSAQTKLLRKTKPNGYVVAQLNRLSLHDVYSSEIKPINSISLIKIALEMGSDMDRFKINDYPPSAAVLYWFVDGIDRAKIAMKEPAWKKICKLAADEFRQQRSLVVAKHDAMMDPVSMAMSACLCSRLRSISNETRLKLGKNLLTYLPSSIELESSIVDLFLKQTESGIWPKFFPLFHYQDAGSNFCFTFELLEAVLFEFGWDHNNVLTEDAVILGLERAISWCETNRLKYPQEKNGKSIVFEGWNSGGNLETLKRGQPESWATAVVHMFLLELVEVLSRHIQKRLLERYEAKSPGGKWKTIKELLDIDLRMGPKSIGLNKTLKDTIIGTFSDFKDNNSGKLRKKPAKKKPLSALLFGPPGTSKTEVAKAIAKELDWPLVEIDPSHFLQNSFQNIYVQAEKIFEDVMDLTGVVLLFDEMDALVQKRDGDATLDTESKFLTTYMLPKLAKLHDRGRLIFLMATNFQAAFDDAIKRAGRFDLLLCMGPPTLKAKCKGLHMFYELDSPTSTAEAGALILKYAADTWTADQLELYTYGEFLSFITRLESDPDKLAAQLKNIKKSGFVEAVKEDSKTVGLRLDDMFDELRKHTAFKKCKTFKDCDKQDFSEAELSAFKINTKLPAIKYLLDRKQTRKQYPQTAKLAKKVDLLHFH